jgi:hypothetical protein
LEAVTRLGVDASGFVAAIDRYVNAVEVADQARREWEREGRPMVGHFVNGMEGLHPLVKTMQQLERDASRFGALLGLDPVSAKRVGGGAARGRPVGAVSAPDRSREPPKLRVAK